MLRDLFLDEVCTLLGRLRITLFCVHLASKGINDLSGTKDIVEDKINLELRVVFEFFLLHVFVVKNSVFFITQFVEFDKINDEFYYGNASLVN